MRLLVTSSVEDAPLTLVHKSDKEVENLQYAILSHRWENTAKGGLGEVTLADIESGTEHLKSITSLNKIRQARKQAAADGYDYLWIDSCCIDKSKSAEESESINSMFAWYSRASVCYAFLSDAPDSLASAESREKFKNSEWFRRGWTLQEILAPEKMEFFAAADGPVGCAGQWVPLGSKAALSLLLAEATGIDQDVLMNTVSLESQSIAKRMSWAARRETTRPEDTAYCLLGIFSVNMPALYGEGKGKAFLRLQEEIMRQSDDQSLFAWIDGSARPDEVRGLLATSPSQFSYSNGIFSYEDWESRDPYAMTNRGLQITMNLSAREDSVYVATLNCAAPPDYEDSTFLAIYVKRLTDKDKQFARVRVGEFAKLTNRGPTERIYFRQKPRTTVESGAYIRHAVVMKTVPHQDVYRVIKVLRPPESGPVGRTRMLNVPRELQSDIPLPRGAGKLAVAIVFERVQDGERLAVVIGSSRAFEIGYGAQELSRGQNVDQLSFNGFHSSWRPSTSGRFELTHHSVRVWSTPLVESSTKYYLTNIGIESLALVSVESWETNFPQKGPEKGEDDWQNGGSRRDQKKKSIWKRLGT